jgi:D-alanyl-D-alanine carboxypeptidase/D-alanyl-D-alanine-endopeptidase (penicillin-binding protein 4)
MRPSRLLKTVLPAVLLFCLTAWPAAARQQARLPADLIRNAVGAADAALLVSPTGRILISENTQQPLVPASILKLLTSLAAFHYLGPDFHFSTDFFLDDRRNLIVKGYGDPLLISEVLASAAPRLAAALQRDGRRFNDIFVDDGYFGQPLTIPGVTASTQPYDAPNGALCVNFNTVYFRKNTRGEYVSAEPQTPLVPPALDRIRTSGLSSGRIILSHHRNAIAVYAGNLVRAALGRQGLIFEGRVRVRTGGSDRARRIYRLVSPFALPEVISRLLAFSNNFIANQLLIRCGIAVSGPPGTLAKGVQAVTAFAREKLGIRTLRLTEGSGISRGNRISAQAMMKVLAGFEPHRTLMRREQCDWYKTGTLKGIRTRAGYLVDARGRTYRYVLMFNSPGKSPGKIMKRLRRAVCGRD